MILSFNDVSFRYSDRPVLQHISFDIQPGEFIGLAGPNGSGKTTLLRLLVNLLKPSSGSIELDGLPLSKIPSRQIARRLAYVPQEHHSEFQFSVHEIVLMGRTPYLNTFGFEREEDFAVASEMMKLMHIDHLADHAIGDLSDGERQRAYLARALVQEADILLLDEPNAHLDIAHQIGIFSILKSINTKKPLTVVFVVHDLNLASLFSQRIVLLKDGFLEAVGKPDAVLTEKIISQVFSTGVAIDKHPAYDTPRVTILPHQIKSY